MDERPQDVAFASKTGALLVELSAGLLALFAQDLERDVRERTEIRRRVHLRGGTSAEHLLDSIRVGEERVRREGVDELGGFVFEARQGAAAYT